MTRHEVNLASAAASTDRSLTAPVSETPEPATPPTAVLAGKHEAGFATNAEPLSAEERRARAAALRGMLLARQRRFGPARRAFAEAIKHDPALDLASVPTFWRLERGGQEAAISAYRDHGREREATMLTARMRQVFRPRLVSSERARANGAAERSQTSVEQT